MRGKLILALLLAAPAVFAQDFYVSPVTGSDANACNTILAPCQTIAGVWPLAEALSATQAVTVALRGIEGPYYGDDGAGGTFTPSFAAPNLITFETYPGDPMAEVTGALTLSGFINTAGIWQVRLRGGVQPGRIFVNGQPRWRSRTNGYLFNAGTVYCSSNTQAACGGLAGACSTYVNSLGKYICYDRCYFNGTDIQQWPDIADGRVEMILFEEWDVSRMYISSVIPEGPSHPGVVFFTGLMHADPSPLTNPKQQNHGCIAGHRYVIENEQALASPGQFYVAKSGSIIALNYTPLPTESIVGFTAQMPQSTTLIQATGAANLTFSGILFDYQNWLPRPGGYISIQGEPDLPAGISFVTSNHISFTGCRFEHFGSWAGEFIGSQVPGGSGYGTNTLTGSAFLDEGGGGWRSGTNNLSTDTSTNVEQNDTLTQNLFDGVGQMVPGAAAIYCGNAINCDIEHNDILGTYYDGIMVGYGFSPTSVTSGVTVSYNRISQVMQGVTSDGACIYLSLASTSSGNIVNNNVCHDVANDPAVYPNDNGYGAHGLYFDAESHGITATNNQIFRTTDTLMRCSACTGVTITNNTMAFSLAGCMFRGMPLNQLSFTFGTNICVLGGTSIANPQADTKPPPGDGGWVCTYSGWVLCSTQFLFQNNLYYEQDGSTPIFVSRNPTVYYTGLGGNNPGSWQNTSAGSNGPNEDLTSIIANPQFNNATYGQDDFGVPGSSPAVMTLGFVQPSYTTTGRVSPAFYPTPPTILNAFTLQIPNESAWGQPMPPAGLPYVNGLKP